MQELGNLLKERGRGAPVTEPHEEEEEDEKCFFIALIILSYITIIFGIVLTFYFCIKAYNATDYLLFKQLFIVNATFSILSLLINILCVLPGVNWLKPSVPLASSQTEPPSAPSRLTKTQIIFGIHFILFYGNFWSNVILFFFMDDYIDFPTWLPVLLPLFLIFFVGIARFVYQMTIGIGHKDNVLYSDFWRPIRIIGICSSLLFCAIVGPLVPVIWIKIYIMSQIISFALFDIMH